MSMDGQFWLGLAFAVPLSIVANLFTPKIQEWLSRRSAAAAARQAAVNSREQARVAAYVQDPKRLIVFQLTAVLLATMVGACIGAFTALLYFTSAIADARFGPLLAPSLPVIGSLMVAGICYEAVKISIKVREAQEASTQADS